MKFLFWIITFVLFFSEYVNGQNMKVTSMTMNPMELSASISPRIDSNGSACALVKVSVTVADVIFGGNLVGDVVRDGSDYWVYMTEGSKKLLIKHPNFKNLEVNFINYGIKGLEERKTYVLDISLPATKDLAYTANSQYIMDKVAEGERLRENRDYDSAYKCFKIAAEAGNAEGQYYLAVCYDEGEGIIQNSYEAFKWYRKAAEQGYAGAQCNLGFCYANGNGITVNYVEAVKWLREAAIQGISVAQFNLGYCYAHGQGVTQDYTEAFKWYRMAAEQGVSAAQCNIGLCYASGQGVTQDYTEAVKWYKKAAEKGNVTAQFNAGRCYQYGEGVSQDYTEALKWYKMAADQGHRQAKKQVETYPNW